MYKKYIAVDQDGNIKFVDFPRKELTEYYGVQHADKLYRDIEGKSYHVGYVVAGHWYEIMKLEPFHTEPR